MDRARTREGVALTSMAVYCVGTPIALFLMTRRYVALRGDRRRWRAARWWRKRATLLFTSYKYSYWWFESIDLLRKLLLASIVLFVMPNTRTQLFFGALVSTVALLIVMQLAPYHSPHCQRAQIIVHVQILFTYLTAQVFHVDARGFDQSSSRSESSCT